MTLAALALVLLAAVLHAVWNFLAKLSHNTIAYLWWGSTFGAIGYGIYLLFTSTIYLPTQVLPYYAISVAAELGFFVTLVRGYQHGDLSLVYPISRGSAPIFIAIWSALFVGERLPLVGYLGLALMVAGIYLASVQPSPARIGDRQNSNRMNTPVLWALASGFFISIYSLSDKVIVSAMSPLVYNWWVYVGNVLAWIPIVWMRGRGATNLQELRENYASVVAGSVMTIGAYILVLVALTTTSASYAVATRGTSVIIGALLGWLALGEGLGRVRVLGSVLMVAGLALIALVQ